MDNSSLGEILPSDAPELVAFGFDSPGDAWLDRLRQSANPAGLGRIGAYELLSEVSRGAQGIVYRARQPNTHRVIALKRLLAGSFATAAMRARFEREVEAAVALQHPNIVTVYGMEFSDGQPLLAMEWIDGRPVDRWAREGRTGPRAPAEILRTFLRICDAVQHAHQRGVLHRDLKPSNILVDDIGEPHVLDFGLAKFLHPSTAAAARLTHTEDFLGTPAYASPEQLMVGNDAVDVRSDVYALGVVLYQLLTGTLPHRSDGNLADLIDAIRQSEPARPSSLNRRLDAELDAIVLRSLAKQKGDRYQSVDAFAADIRRHLAGEPVEARRTSRWYLLRKTARRYRAVLAVTVVFFILVTCSAAALLVMYGRQGKLLAQTAAARDSERQVRRNAQQLQAVFQQMLLSVSEIGKATDLPIRRELLDKAAAKMDFELAEQPDALATAHDTAGKTYQNLGLYDDAERHLRTALAIREKLYGREHLGVAATLDNLGDLLRDRNRYGEAGPLIREALAIRQKLMGDEHPDIAASLNHLGLAMQDRHNYDEAEQLHRNALAMYRRLLGEENADVAYSLTQLGYALFNKADAASAELVFRQALEMYSRLRGGEHRDVAGAKITLAKVLHARGSHAAAETLFREGIASYRKLLGDEHDNVAWGLHRLGVLMHDRGDYVQAESLLHEALAIYRKVFGNDDPYVADVLNSLGTLLLDQGDYSAAEQAFEESTSFWRKRLGHEAPLVLWKLNRLGELRQAQKNYAIAEPLLRTALANRGESGGHEHCYLVRTLRSLANLLLDRGEFVEAEAVFRESLDLRCKIGGPDHPEAVQGMADLARVLQVRGEFQQAELLLLDGYRRVESDPEFAVRRRELVQQIVKLYEAWGKTEQAAEWRSRLPASGTSLGPSR